MNLILIICLGGSEVLSAAPDIHSTLDSCIERCAETMRENAIAQHNARLSEGLRLMRVEMERAADAATNVRHRTNSAMDSSRAALSALDAAGLVLARVLVYNTRQFLNPTTSSEQYHTEHLALWDNLTLLKKRIEEQDSFARILQHEQELYDEHVQNAQEFYEALTRTELMHTHVQAMLRYGIVSPPAPERVVSANDVQKMRESAKAALVELEIFQKEVIEFSRLSSEMCKDALEAARRKYPLIFKTTNKPQNTSKFSCFAGLFRL